MHRCGGQVGNVLGPCTCTAEYQTNSAFSMLFSSMPTTHKPANYNNYDHHDDVLVQDQMYYSSSSQASSHVDCTLSLGTPSTRLSNEKHHHSRRPAAASCISNFCFDILHSKNTNTTTPSSPSPLSPPYKTTSGRTTTNGNNNNNNNNNNNSDSLVARRCANCDTTSTPLWRNGPRGPKSLCNACGIRFKKEERRASAAASTTTANSNNSNGASLMEVNPWGVHHQQQYSQQQQQSQKMHCISSAGNDQFRFIEDEQSADNTIPFLSWRLNVTDRPSLIHDFTR